jgi:hypothetical protein
MSNDQEQKMKRLQAQLPGEFSLDKRSECVFELHNTNCIIEVLFERFDSNQAMTFLYPPEQPSVKLHLLLLRHLRGVKISSEEQHSQDRFELIGRIIAEHFRDLLEGNFGIIDDYKRIEKRFFPAIIKVHSLRSDDPVKIMFQECNIAWLDTLESREQQNLE